MIAAGSAVPEGPIALADGSVIVVEIAGGRLTRVLPGGEKAHGGANWAAARTARRSGPTASCYVCNNGGFSWRTDERGFMRPTGRPTTTRAARIQRVDLETGAVRDAL